MMPKTKDLPVWFYLVLWLVPPGLAAVLRFTDFHLTGYTFCLIYRFTGFPCLTCGSTRALDALIQGALLQSLRLNPLPLLLAIWYLAFLAGMTVLKIKNQECPVKIRRVAGWAMFSVTLFILVFHWLIKIIFLS